MVLGQGGRVAVSHKKRRCWNLKPQQFNVSLWLDTKDLRPVVTHPLVKKCRDGSLGGLSVGLRLKKGQGKVSWVTVTRSGYELPAQGFTEDGPQSRLFLRCELKKIRDRSIPLPPTECYSLTARGPKEHHGQGHPVASGVTSCRLRPSCHRRRPWASR